MFHIRFWVGGGFVCLFDFGLCVVGLGFFVILVCFFFSSAKDTISSLNLQSFPISAGLPGPLSAS